MTKPCFDDNKGNPIAIIEILGSKKNGIAGGLYGYGRGRFHDGVDFKAPIGTPIYSIFTGVVGKAVNSHIQGEDWADVENWNYDKKGAGNRIYINSNINGNTIQFGYWHMTHIAMNPATGKAYKTGDQVNQGSIIGFVGTTGNANSNSSAGSHLHLRGRINGQKTDPLVYIFSEIDLTNGKGVPRN